MLHQSFLGKWKLLSSSSSAAKLNLCGKRRRWCLFYFSRNKEGTFYSRNFFFNLAQLSCEAFCWSRWVFFDWLWGIAMATKSMKVKLGSAFLETEHFTCSKTVLNRWQGCNECYWSILCVSYKRWTSILNKNALRGQDGTISEYYFHKLEFCWTSPGSKASSQACHLKSIWRSNSGPEKLSARIILIGAAGVRRSTNCKSSEKVALNLKSTLFL